MQEKYGDEVEFVLVYMAEAHSLDGGQANLRGNSPIVEEPIIFEERISVAQRCAVGMDLGKMILVIDEMDNAVSLRWQAHPDRLYLIGKDGKVFYQGAKGPRGFSTKELEAAIQMTLEKPLEKPLETDK